MKFMGSHAFSVDIDENFKTLEEIEVEEIHPESGRNTAVCSVGRCVRWGP
jgi:hypothetical protein